MRWLRFAFTICVIALVSICFIVFLRPVLISHIQEEQIKTKNKALLITLDYLHPSFLELGQFAQGKISLSQDQWSEYILYYSKVLEALPNMAEAYLLNGYCHFQSQDPSQTLELLEKSIQANPYLFWSYYDIGLLLLNKNFYKEAAKIFQIAINIPPQASLYTILQSKIYADIGTTLPSFNQEAAQRLSQGYERAAILLNLSIKLSQDSSDSKTQKILKTTLSSLSIQFF